MKCLIHYLEQNDEHSFTCKYCGKTFYKYVFGEKLWNKIHCLY